MHAIHCAIPGSSPTRSAGPRAVINRASRCRPSRNGRRASGRSVYLCTGARGGNCPLLPGRVPQLARSISRSAELPGMKTEDCSGSWLSRTLAAPTVTSPLSCVLAARQATGCGSSSRRSPAWDTAGRHGRTRLPRWTRPGPDWPVRSPGARLIGCATILTGLTGCTAELRSFTFIIIWQLDHKGDPLFLYRSHISPSTIISVLPSSHASHSSLSVNGGTAPDAQVG